LMEHAAAGVICGSTAASSQRRTATTLLCL